MRAATSIALALLAAVMLSIPSTSSAQVSVGVSIRIGPPALPVYPQPICPGPGYLWTPGYWAYGPDGYYWVPGTWIIPPRVGFLWTPGYWGWGEGVYLWHAGYWGPHVGFYGGINYGFGYVGVGYLGGYWNRGVFNYNTTVNNVNVTNIHNTYNKTVVNNVTVNRTSFNGGTGGTTAQPNAQEQAAARENHVQPTAEQTQHEHASSTNRAQLASVNRGQPTVAATRRPGAFSGPGVVRAAGATGPNNAGRNGFAGKGPGAGGPRPNAGIAARNAEGATPRRPNNQGPGKNPNAQRPRNRPQGGGEPRGEGEPRGGGERPR
jgi:WXXGXW repeat (2 copies)